MRNNNNVDLNKTEVESVQLGYTLKFDPNQTSNSCDIADMDKCPQEKCYLDKCQRHHDS